MAYNPPVSSIYHFYTTYILPSGGLYATYHLLGEPETTIDISNHLVCYGILVSIIRENLPPKNLFCKLDPDHRKQPSLRLHWFNSQHEFEG